MKMIVMIAVMSTTEALVKIKPDFFFLALLSLLPHAVVSITAMITRIFKTKHGG